MGIKYPRLEDGRGDGPPQLSLNGLRSSRVQNDRLSPDGRSIFKASPKGPSPDDSAGCIKYFHHVENKLKKWCQSQCGDLVAKTVDIWDRILPYIENLLKAASIIFELETQYYLEKELDTRIWKYGIYRFIAILRSNNFIHGTEQIVALKEIIKTGIRHFEDLLKVGVPKVLNIQLEPIFARSSLLKVSGGSEAPSLEEDMIYRVFIYMGDMYRYRFQLDRDQHGAKMAKSMYVGARFCDSRKSRAYYQLGLMAKTQGDFIGMIYNFTRAFHVSSPADGALQQLQLIYGDMSIWYGKCKASFWYTRMKVADKMYSRDRRPREHIWIAETDSNCIKKILPDPALPPSRRDHLESLPETEVFTRFSLTYAHFLGMLYTNIGTEHLEHVSKELMVYFEGLIIYKNYNKFYFLMEVIGLILFLVDHLEPPVPTSSNAPLVAQKTHMRDLAINTSLEMFMILAEKVRKIVRHLDWDNPMLAPCSAALHVWCNWALRRRSLKAELRQQLIVLTGSYDGEDRGCRASFASSFLQLASLLAKLFVQNDFTLFPKFKLRPKDNYIKPLNMLPEQIALDGFSEVMFANDFATSKLYFNKDFQLERAQLFYRFGKILQLSNSMFGKLEELTLLNYSCGDKPIDWIYEREFDVMNTIYTSRDELGLNQRHKRQSNANPDCNNARIIIISSKSKVNEIKPDLGKTSPKSAQRIEKVNLTVVHEIFSQLSLIGVRTEMVIIPSRVVLDTNTFIRNKDWIRSLIYYVPYPLIIPTTVLLELRGLAKGAKTGESPRISQKQLTLDEQKWRIEEVMKVGEQCVEALEFLDNYKRYFKLVTVEGKEVKMYKYKTQKVFDKRFDPSVRNDEKILETCRQLEDQDKASRAQDHPLRIYRKTVLLTGDRSLRVRAYAQDIPARDIQSFTDWIINYKQPDGGQTTNSRSLKNDKKLGERVEFKMTDIIRVAISVLQEDTRKLKTDITFSIDFLLTISFLFNDLVYFIG